MNNMKIASPHNDYAENSIMQTISIAVSAILISAGLITAPSLINNARDTNAKQDLTNIAMAQEYALADSGTYQSKLDNLSSASGSGVKLTTSVSPSKISIVTGTAPNPCYAAFAQSASGAVHYKVSESSSARTVPKPWPATAPTGYPTSCISWPLTAADATENIAPPLSDWILSAGATYNPADQSITLNTLGAGASAPLIRVDGASEYAYTVDGKLPALVTGKNYVTYGIAYYAADGVTSVPNPLTYTSNGDLGAIATAGMWTRVKAPSIGTPGSYAAPATGAVFVRISIIANTTYTQIGMQVRNPTFAIVTP